MVHSMEPMQSGTDETLQKSRPGGGWLFPTLLAIVLMILFGLARLASNQRPQQEVGTTDAWTPSPLPVGETIGLSVDFGNGAKKEFAALPWREEMTVADLLEAARRFQPGIRFSQIGSGESGLLNSLDGLANEGAGGRNWLYRVDDRHAHVSFCLEKLEPGMHVLWTFTDEQYNAESAEE